jgi:hypothetical protein
LPIYPVQKTSIFGLGIVHRSIDTFKWLVKALYPTLSAHIS